MVATRESFKKGECPRDFQKDKSAEIVLEGSFEDHGARVENILTDTGLKAMGFKKFDDKEAGLTEGQRKVRQMANKEIAK
jgi:hypothetical protein